MSEEHLRGRKRELVLDSSGLSSNRQMRGVNRQRLRQPKIGQLDDETPLPVGLGSGVLAQDQRHVPWPPVAEQPKGKPVGMNRRGRLHETSVCGERGRRDEEKILRLQVAVENILCVRSVHGADEGMPNLGYGREIMCEGMSTARTRACQTWRFTEAKSNMGYISSCRHDVRRTFVGTERRTIRGHLAATTGDKEKKRGTNLFPLEKFRRKSYAIVLLSEEYF